MNYDAPRFEPDVKQGLTDEQVKQRIEEKLTNKTKMVVGKSYFKIVTDNVFSFFAILLYIVFVFMLIGNIYTEGRFILSGCFFMVILLGNIVIGLYEDIKARRLMDKMHLINAPKARVIRNGKEIEIKTEDIVLDDIICFSQNSQITADCIILKGTVAVNESELTGEADNVYKKYGSILYSGTYVTSGSCIAQVDKVGKDSYIEHIQETGKKFKRSKSEILSSLKTLFRIIGIGVIIMAVATIVTYSVQGRFSSMESFAQAIPFIGGCFVSMLPTGLYLLTSLTLAVAVIALAKKRANVQDFYSVEMLARTDTLCVDKTGTITDGSMKVKNIISFGKHTDIEIKNIIFNIVSATKDNNATAKALTSLGIENKLMRASAVLPFNSDNKYSAATFKGVTYILGAPEFINIKTTAKINNTIDEYVDQGFRVLLLSETKQDIKDNKCDAMSDPIAVIVLEDNIKPSAPETFKWFKENDVSVVVISGDNAKAVSQIAKQAGVAGAERYISLEGFCEEEVKNVANLYTVFGRVTPEQKQWIVETLQENKHTVAMTGDGVNDILALKKADCSIAMASGAEAARNISHLVMMDSDFASLPAVVEEGRRVINNLQRTCSLFLVKTLFAFIMAFTFLLAAIIKNDPTINYPFLTNQMYLWEFANLGLASFFLALERNSERLSGSFLKNILLKAIPAGVFVSLSSLVVFLAYLLNKNGILYTGIATKEVAITMCTILFTCLSFIVLLKTCLPFTKYRLCVFIGAGIIDILGFIYTAFIAPLIKNQTFNFFKIDFKILGPQNYIFMIVVFVVIVTLYFFTSYVYEIFKKNMHLEEEAK